MSLSWFHFKHNKTKSREATLSPYHTTGRCWSWMFNPSAEISTVTPLQPLLHWRSFTMHPGIRLCSGAFCKEVMKCIFAESLTQMYSGVSRHTWKHPREVNLSTISLQALSDTFSALVDSGRGDFSLFSGTQTLIRRTRLVNVESELKIHQTK